MERLIFLEDRKYDISGPGGNAFAVVGSCVDLMKRCDVPREKINEFRDEAFSGDYDNLLKVCTEATGITFTDGKDDSPWLN